MRLHGRNLRAGMAGDDITALHNDLDQLGYPIPANERADQVFGVGTAAAIAQFQRAHGLWDTAVVDTHTAGMLDRAIAEASMPTDSVPVASRPPARPAPEGEPTRMVSTSGQSAVVGRASAPPDRPAPDTQPRPAERGSGVPIVGRAAAVGWPAAPVTGGAASEEPTGTPVTHGTAEEEPTGAPISAYAAEEQTGVAITGYADEEPTGLVVGARSTEEPTGDPVPGHAPPDEPTLTPWMAGVPFEEPTLIPRNEPGAAAEPLPRWNAPAPVDEPTLINRIGPDVVEEPTFVPWAAASYAPPASATDPGAPADEGWGTPGAATAEPATAEPAAPADEGWGTPGAATAEAAATADPVDELTPAPWGTHAPAGAEPTTAGPAAAPWGAHPPAEELTPQPWDQPEPTPWSPAPPVSGVIWPTATTPAEAAEPAPAGVPESAAERPTRPYQVAVCGPGDCTDDERSWAYRVGELLAGGGAVVICGGGTGVMAAVAEGARSGGGLVLGILPGRRGQEGPEPANPYLSAVIATDLGEARNAVIVQSADAVIAIGGSWGTLSELALARRRGGIPVVCLGGWQVLDAQGRPVPGIDTVDTPEAAVDRALADR